MSIEIRPATPADLPQIAKIHYAAFGNDHFTSIFPQDLLEKFYEEVLKDSPDSYVGLYDGQVTSFVITGAHTAAGVKRFTKRNKARLMGLMLRHPKHLAEKIKIKLFPPRFNSSTPYRLMSIGVSPSFQGKGIGRFLLLNLDRILVEKGITQFGLSVRRSNKRALQFYERQGFVNEGETWLSVYYVRTLPNTIPSP